VAVAAGQHDGLVVATHLARERQLQGAEVTGEVGPAELVVVRRAADRPVDHDLECGGDAAGLAVVAFPRLPRTVDVQVGNAEAGEPGLGLPADAGRALVPQLAAGTGAGPRMRR